MAGQVSWTSGVRVRRTAPRRWRRPRRSRGWERGVSCVPSQLYETPFGLTRKSRPREGQAVEKAKRRPAEIRWTTANEQAAPTIDQPTGKGLASTALTNRKPHRDAPPRSYPGAEKPRARRTPRIRRFGRRRRWRGRSRPQTPGDRTKDGSADHEIVITPPGYAAERRGAAPNAFRVRSRRPPIASSMPTRWRPCCSRMASYPGNTDPARPGSRRPLQVSDASAASRRPPWLPRPCPYSRAAVIEVAVHARARTGPLEDEPRP